MSNIKVIILSALLHIAKHPICHDIEEILHCLSLNETSADSLRPIETIPGETGPPGEKGDVGDPGRQGPPCVMDYERISSMIEQKVSQEIEKNNMLNSFKLQLDDMSSGLTRAEGNIWKLQSHEGICGMKYEEKCLWSEVRVHGVNYEEGREICKARGGVLANIYSRQHFNETVAYLRTQISDPTVHVIFWLGMRAIPERSEFTLADGTPAPYVIWQKGFPSTDPNYTHFGMTVRGAYDPRYPDNMKTSPPSQLHFGVLCEI